MHWQSRAAQAPADALHGDTMHWQSPEHPVVGGSSALHQSRHCDAPVRQDHGGRVSGAPVQPAAHCAPSARLHQCWCTAAGHTKKDAGSCSAHICNIPATVLREGCAQPPRARPTPQAGAAVTFGDCAGCCPQPLDALLDCQAQGNKMYTHTPTPDNAAQPHARLGHQLLDLCHS